MTPMGPRLSFGCWGALCSARRVQNRRRRTGTCAAGATLPLCPCPMRLRGCASGDRSTWSPLIAVGSSMLSFPATTAAARRSWRCGPAVPGLTRPPLTSLTMNSASASSRTLTTPLWSRRCRGRSWLRGIHSCSMSTRARRYRVWLFCMTGCRICGRTRRSCTCRPERGTLSLR